MSIQVIKPREPGVSGSAPITIIAHGSGQGVTPPPALDPSGATPNDLTKPMPYTTLQSVVEDVKLWLRGNTVEDEVIKGAINDGISSLWSSLIKSSLSLFMGGPVSLSIGAAEERELIVSIADPEDELEAFERAGGGLDERDVWLAYTYVTDSGTETLISPVLETTISAGMITEISSPAFAEGAVGWNLYASLTAEGRLCKQNDEPIPFGVVALESEGGFESEPDRPSPPTENTTGDNIFYIRHLEHAVPGTTSYQPWRQGDLDSTLMERAARTIAAADAYRPYAWDLINQRTLEIRPAAAIALNPRYFYIQKPRRLRFESSPIPFPTIDAVEFLKKHALSDIFLSLEEYQAAKAWGDKAEAVRQRCKEAVGQMNRGKNNRITPYRA